jgi:uncharacterized protein (TIGR02001 family)
MKKLTLASAILATLTATIAQAQQAAPAPDHVVAFNVGATSDYRFRGISQTRGDPAVFAGVDYTHAPTGFYLGAWTSNIRWVKDAGSTSGSYEVDVYGGKRGQIGAIAYDAGVISYNYPGNKLKPVTGANANTVEAFVQAGYGFATLKYSYALTDFIGWGPRTDGSDYIDLSLNPEIKDGYVLNLHVGRQRVKNYSDGLANYTDWKVGVTKDYSVVVGSLAVVGTNADKSTSGYNFGGKGYLGDTKLVLTLTKNF